MMCQQSIPLKQPVLVISASPHLSISAEYVGNLCVFPFAQFKTPNLIMNIMLYINLVIQDVLTKISNVQIVVENFQLLKICKSTWN